MAKRTANGMGSLSRRSDGRWEAKVSYINQDGTPARKSVSVSTQAEVKAKMKEMLSAQERGETIAPTVQTVEGFPTQWLEISIRANVRPSTYTSYRQLCTLYIIPALGQVQVGKLTALDVQRFVTRLAGHIVKRTGKPMSKRTVQYAYSVLKAALKQAVDWNILARSPADKVKAPRKGRPEASFLNPEQVRHFLLSTTGDKHECLYALASPQGYARASF